MASTFPLNLTGPYAEAHRFENLGGPGDARPTGLQIVHDEGLEGAWPDKVCLVTGVSSGMGVSTVRALAATGATVFGTARNLARAGEELGDLLPSGRVHLLFMDQTDLASVRACAAEFKARSDKLHILVNNAGIMKVPEGRTKDGFEMHMGTNHLSHFLLFHELLDRLLASATPAFHARVLNVSSLAHRAAPLRVPADVDVDGAAAAAAVEEDDDDQRRRPYDGWAAYAASKNANIHMATQIERLYGARGLHAHSLSPGFFLSPNLQDGTARAETDAALATDAGRRYLASRDQGCATSVYGAVARALEGRGGLFLEGASVAGPAPEGAGLSLEAYGYAAWAFDEAREAALWALSEKLVGVE